MSAVTDKIDAAIALMQEARALATPAPTAPYAARTDRTPEPKPMLPSLGPAGFRFTDPVFGSKMLRVTDSKLGAGSWRVASNAHLASWNADGSRFYVMSSQGNVVPHLFNAAALTATPALSWPYSQTEPTYSFLDPDVLFTVGGAQTRTIRKHSFTANTYTDVVDLDLLGLPYNLTDPRTYCTVQVAGDPEAVFVMFGGKSQDDHYLVMKYTDEGANFFNSLDRFGRPLHAISVDRSGRYVLLYPVGGGSVNGIPQVIIWDTVSDHLEQVTEAPAGHGCMGFGAWINQDQGTLAYDALQWQMRRLSAPNGPRVSLVDPPMTPKLTYLADHTAWRNVTPQNIEPVISATYRYPVPWQNGVPVPDVPWRCGDDEIIALATETPSRMWRFGHHRSNVADDLGPKNPDGSPLRPYFAYQPMISVSPSGKHAIFHSNWEKTLGWDPTDPGHYRQDVFLIELS